MHWIAIAENKCNCDCYSWWPREPALQSHCPDRRHRSWVFCPTHTLGGCSSAGLLWPGQRCSGCPEREQQRTLQPSGNPAEWPKVAKEKNWAWAAPGIHPHQFFSYTGYQLRQQISSQKSELARNEIAGRGASFSTPKRKLSQIIKITWLHSWVNKAGNKITSDFMW